MSSSRSRSARSLRLAAAIETGGERCSIAHVLWPSRASTGITVAAVAPEPMTTTFLARVVDAVVPLLRVDQQALVVAHARPVAEVGVVVVVVAPGTSTGNPRGSGRPRRASRRRRVSTVHSFSAVDHEQRVISV